MAFYMVFISITTSITSGATQAYRVSAAALLAVW